MQNCVKNEKMIKKYCIKHNLIRNETTNDTFLEIQYVFIFLKLRQNN